MTGGDRGSVEERVGKVVFWGEISSEGIPATENTTKGEKSGPLQRGRGTPLPGNFREMHC